MALSHSVGLAQCCQAPAMMSHSPFFPPFSPFLLVMSSHDVTNGTIGGRKAAPSSLVTHYSEQFTAFPTVPAVPTPSRFVVPELHTLRVPQQRTLHDGVSKMESNGERACPIDTGEISSSAWRASERQSPLIFGGARYAHRLPVYPSYDYAMCSCEFWFSVVRRRVLATCRASGSAHRALLDVRRVARLALVGDSSSFFLVWVLLNCG